MEVRSVYARTAEGGGVMAESTICILAPMLGIYVVLLLVFLRLGNIQDLLIEIRDAMKKEVK